MFGRNFVRRCFVAKVEKIRMTHSEYNQHFLKYDGIFRDGDDQSALILKMESGRSTLDDILEAGKKFSCK